MRVQIKSGNAIVQRLEGTICANRERYAAHEAEHGTYGVFSAAEGVVHRHHDPRWMTELLSGFDTVADHEFAATTWRGNSARGFQFVGRSRRTSDTR